MLRKMSSNLLNTLSKRSFISLNHPRLSSAHLQPEPAPSSRSEEEQQQRRHKSNRHSRVTVPVLAASSFLSWFTKKSDEDSPESQLITAIKMSILNIQREEYKKAEQMLHVALKMAQDLQSKDGVTYIYDIMANLAMEVGDFKKAEKLFANVMQRLFADGFVEDHIKMLHISSKIAHIAQLQGHLDKALQGFEWTLAKLEENLKKVGEDKEIRELWGITKNWYALALMELKRFAEAKTCFIEAYDAYTEIHGKLTEEGLTILNNLSVACSNVTQKVHYHYKTHQLLILTAGRLRVRRAVPQGSDLAGRPTAGPDRGWGVQSEPGAALPAARAAQASHRVLLVRVEVRQAAPARGNGDAGQLLPRAD